MSGAGVAAVPRAAGGCLWNALRSDPVVLVVFLSMLMLGGDKVAISISGLNFRVVFPLLMTAVALLYLKVERRISFDTTLGFFFFALCTAGALSVIGSQAPLKSVGYTIWVLFDFFIVISVCYNFAKLYDVELTLSLWLLVFRIHAVLLVLEFIRNVAFHTFDRPHLWFYEPSYLAVFMTGYYGAALYLALSRGRRYLWDVALIAVAVLTMSSATAIFGVLFATLFNVLIARQRLKLLIWSSLVFSGGLGLLYTFLKDTRYFQLTAGFLFQEGGINLILERGGDRWPRVLIGWDAFLHHPWLGVGIGADDAYMHTAAYPEQVVGMLRAITDVRAGEPFCNIFVEVLGTMGIVGFIPFICILGYAAWRMSGLGQKQHPPPEAVVFLTAFFCTLLAMQLDGTVLRYYVWSPLGLGLGCLARTRAKMATLAAPANQL
jgi:O-antigen ligase